MWCPMLSTRTSLGAGSMMAKSKLIAFNEAVQMAGLEPKSGLQAIKNEHRRLIKANKKSLSYGSSNVDGGLQAANPQEHRWDYVIGFGGSNCRVIWVEFHRADSTHEVINFLKKLSWLKSKLKTGEFSRLNDLTQVSERLSEKPFRWIHQGKSKIKRESREARILAQNGMSGPEHMLEL